MIHRPLASALLLILLTSPSFAGDIYKWVDKNGKTHFGDRPPVGVTQAQEVKIRDIPEADRRVPSNEDRRSRQDLLIEYFEEDRAKKKQTAASEKEQREKLAAQCAQATRRLQEMRQSNYLYEVDDSGNKVIQSDARREKATRSLENKIRKNCR